MSDAKEIKSDGEANYVRREAMSVGEAAKLLGLSVPAVQRLCEANEANPEADPPVGISFAWSMGGTYYDSLGRPLRGSRRLFRDSVVDYGLRTGLLKKT